MFTLVATCQSAWVDFLKSTDSGQGLFAVGIPFAAAVSLSNYFLSFELATTLTDQLGLGSSFCWYGFARQLVYLMPQVTSFCPRAFSAILVQAFLLRGPARGGVFVAIIVGFCRCPILDLLSELGY